jgi:hypothetical protein
MCRYSLDGISDPAAPPAARRSVRLQAFPSLVGASGPPISQPVLNRRWKPLQSLAIYRIPHHPNRPKTSKKSTVRGFRKQNSPKQDFWRRLSWTGVLGGPRTTATRVAALGERRRPSGTGEPERCEEEWAASRLALPTGPSDAGSRDRLPGGDRKPRPGEASGATPDGRCRLLLGTGGLQPRSLARNVNRLARAGCGPTSNQFEPRSFLSSGIQWTSPHIKLSSTNEIR